MKVLQLVKYYDPCQGGMETVVKNIVEGIIDNSNNINFTIYSNNHSRDFVKYVVKKNREIIIKEITLFFLKASL
jgi:hypothetical protein